MNSNGAKGQVPILFAFATLVIAIVSSVAGGAYALGRHTGDTGIHEPAPIKEQRIRTVIDRELTPQLKYQSEAIARMERELRELREAMESQKK